MFELILPSARGRAVAPDTSRILGAIAKGVSDDTAQELSIHEYERPSARASLQVGGSGVLLEYAGGSRGDGLRPLSVARIERHGDELYLFGVCHISGKCQSFRGDRILSIVDPGTGEVYRNIVDWHESGQFADLGMFRRCREDLVLLTYLARADGQVCWAELDQIEMYLDRTATDIGDCCPSRAAIETMAYGLAPEWTAASLACASLRKQPERASRLWRTIRHVVEADGQLHISEQDLVGEVRAGLGIQ